MPEWIEAAARECTESMPLDTDDWQHFARIIWRHYDLALATLFADWPTCGELSCDDCDARALALRGEVGRLQSRLSKAQRLLSVCTFDAPEDQADYDEVMDET